MPCPAVEPGDLVVTEIRGKQTGSYRQWIEIYNASDATLDLVGLRFTLTRRDGTSPVSFLVREDGQEFEPGTYFVLGGGDPDTFRYIDYDYTVDFHSTSDATQPRDLYGSAVLEVHACGVLIDRLFYDTLPTAGTLALDGSNTPDAATNDNTAVNWCVDDRPSEGPQTEIGIRGTPGEENPPCP